MTHKNIVPLKENLWVEEEGVHYLIGNKCANCEEVLFPYKQSTFCPQCHTDQLKKVNLSRSGVISAVTVVNAEPAGGFYKGPVPYCYGIIRLDDDVNILSLFVEMDWEQLKVGQKVELIVEKLYETEEEEVVTYKFKPVTN